MNPVVLAGVATCLLAINFAALHAIIDLFLPVFIADLSFFIVLARFFARSSRDPLHPLSLILLAFTLRLAIPTILLLCGQLPLLEWGLPTIWAQPERWQPGFCLSAIGIISVTLPFLVLQPMQSAIRACTSVVNWRGRSLLHAARVTTCLGLALWLTYLLINFRDVRGVIDALNTGILRSGEHALPGTSRYSFVAKQCIVWGGCTWTLCRYSINRYAMTAMLPAAVAFVALLPAGGRVAAASPVVLAGLGIAQLARQGNHPSASPWRLSRSRLFLSLLAGTIVVALFAMLVKIYRGAGLATALAQITVSELLAELEFSAWYETGFLHPYALAIEFGPGLYDAPLSRLLFGGYAAHLLALNDTLRPGELLMWQTMGTTGWGIHTGLVVDMYMLFGPLGSMLSCAVVGLLLRATYVNLVRRRHGLLPVLAYLFVFWQLFWILFESAVGSVSAFVEHSCGLVAICILAALLPQPRVGLA